MSMRNRAKSLEPLYLVLPKHQIDKLDDEALKILDHLRSLVMREFLDWGFERFCDEIAGLQKEQTMEVHNSSYRKCYSIIAAFTQSYIRKLEKTARSAHFPVMLAISQFFQRDFEKFLVERNIKTIRRYIP